MSDFIWDGITGQQLAWINNGGVFSVTTKQKVARVRDGELYSVKGERLNLRLQHRGCPPGPTLAAFEELMADDLRAD
jgi:hypothetical protein